MFLPPFVRVIYLVLWVKMNKGHNNATTTHKILCRVRKIYIWDDDKYIYIFKWRQKHEKLSAPFVCESPYCDELDITTAKIVFPLFLYYYDRKKDYSNEIEMFTTYRSKNIRIGRRVFMRQTFPFLVGFCLKPRRQYVLLKKYYIQLGVVQG